MIDNKTTNLLLPLPHADNSLTEDVVRLRDALVAIDSAIHAKPSSSDITSAVNAVIGAAPGALNTLVELSAALGNDASFASTVTNSLALKEASSNKNSSGGYAGLTLFKINFRNDANTFTSFLTNSNTGARTYTFKDSDGTVAFTSDITGTNSGINTGDNATNSQYASDYRAANFVAGVNYGFANIPQNSQSAAYGLVLSDAGKHIYHPGADTTARTYTIPANASVSYPIGTALTFVNDTSGGVVTIAITTDTMILAGAGTTGSRTLAANGIATALKVTATRWIISGTGLT